MVCIISKPILTDIKYTTIHWSPVTEVYNLSYFHGLPRALRILTGSPPVFILTQLIRLGPWFCRASSQNDPSLSIKLDLVPYTSSCRLEPVWHLEPQCLTKDGAPQTVEHRPMLEYSFSLFLNLFMKRYIQKTRVKHLVILTSLNWVYIILAIVDLL